MVKYKLIKEYPGSPKLGTECSQLENDTITAYPEYWQEIKQKEVKLCVPIGTKFKHVDLEHDTIYTVAERVDDEKVKFTWNDGANSILWKIKFMNELFAKGTYIEYKEPKVLFITEDGVKIQENDLYWCVNIVNYNLWLAKCKTNTQLHRDYKAFSTQKEAENYIKINKSVLSYGDVMKLYDNLSHLYHRENYKKELTKLIKSKIT